MSRAVKSGRFVERCYVTWRFVAIQPNQLCVILVLAKMIIHILGSHRHIEGNHDLGQSAITTSKLSVSNDLPYARP